MDPAVAVLALTASAGALALLVLAVVLATREIQRRRYVDRIAAELNAQSQAFGMTGPHVVETDAPMLGMLIQVEGERAFLDRHLVFEDAETKELYGRTAFLSVDGFWCSWVPNCACRNRCLDCRATLRATAASRRARRESRAMAGGS
ncbi:hypothetical protein [Kutzneria kofuensis]|uniref:Uncharacterized protein n=1 Tax=Kutzneria kofuensis TaxID=103725 RepID=A0A7W9NG21_9PSEU|nr:hypothetical protein [Kutzneria kofuensis]MBB5890648.1 hypothetical protein [Kutzneria kofuensis]